jgi:hypothetical protein
MVMEVLTNKGTSTGNIKRVTKEELEKMRKEANRMVKGIFRCHEPRGGSVQLVWREFKGDPIRRWTLVDGHEYELPIGLARHLNNNCNYAVHQHILGSDGKAAVDKVGKKISRMNFESIEYYG